MPIAAVRSQDEPSMNALLRRNAPQRTQTREKCCRTSRRSSKSRGAKRPPLLPQNPRRRCAWQGSPMRLLARASRVHTAPLRAKRRRVDCPPRQPSGASTWSYNIWILAVRVGLEEKREIPPPRCVHEGKKRTVVVNFAELCGWMQRSVEHVT